jgi:putative MATE family efflux protein
MFIGLGTAFTIRLAHLRGARQDGERRDVVVSLALLAIAWSVGCILLVTVLAAPVLALMGIKGALAAQCARFIGVLSIGFPGIFGSAAVSAYLRGLGNSRAAMWVQGSGNALNVVLVLLFVARLHFGIAGAALATATASTVALVVGMISAARIYPLPRGRPTRQAVRRELVDAVRLGFPLAIQHIFLALGIMVLVWIIQAYGEVVLAAFTIVSRLEAFTAMLFLAFSGAMTTFAAQNLGGRDTDRARRGLLRTVGLTVGLTVLTSLVVLVANAPIAGLFTADEATRRIAQHYIMIIYPFLPLYTVMVVLHGYLNGARRTTAPLLCTILAFGMVQLPFAAFLNRLFGIDAVMWAVVASWATGLTYSVYCLRRVLMPRPYAEARGDAGARGNADAGGDAVPGSLKVRGAS